ncbi:MULTISPECIES: 2-C-methyl-D-erythritol 4-phosphate cytidylyltransferase [Cytobacillus]|uniref:2-C-methyl-D-erythritol 4-phosphate cytidylyltransferase n=1 Tax=Cytobacillus kochii TaxID=859143 RepID=A0A248THI3_9BACI|nr:2-C-methyl-D-erythritol 4-phosphate cytidylyltransferase [Cytobacillus kochii]ASV67677.1 2-C-methyl-D-erythritol 4-phosphate cytidylyltransferase [Cytobacillus kochii]
MGYRVVIPAAGQGKRMGASKNKLLLELRGVPIFIHTLRVFQRDSACEGIYLAINPAEEKEIRALIAKHGVDKVRAYIGGGQERQHSISHVIRALTGEGIVLVHDAARPFVEQEHIDQLVSQAQFNDGAILAVPVKDTIKKGRDGLVEGTIDRTSLWSVQTPQAFKLSILQAAYEKAQKDQFVGTDDASLVERVHNKIAFVQGNYDNIKLTTPEDLYFAEAILNKRDDFI